MPRVKKAEFYARNNAGHSEKLVVDINVNAAGEFYCTLPELLFDIAIKREDVMPIRTKRFQVATKKMETLTVAIQNALEVSITPVVTEETVIRYNIESHVSFAEDPDGNIFPNAGFKNAKWPASSDRDRYGNHYANTPARGGYSLTVGATAQVKTTHSYGDKVTVKYRDYNGKGDHLRAACPASLLNSWVGFSLGDRPKEMPYSDNAATFFHELMLSMAALSRRVQSIASDQEKLLEIINSGQLLLPGKSKS